MKAAQKVHDKPWTTSVNEGGVSDRARLGFESDFPKVNARRAIIPPTPPIEPNMAAIVTSKSEIGAR